MQAVEVAELFSEVVPSKLWWSSLPEDAQLLEQCGVDVVYDLADEDSTDDLEIRAGRTYIKYSFEDGPEFDPKSVVRLSDRIAADINSGHRVLVHCTFGKNRSGLVVALAIRRLFSLTGRQALDRVRSVRHRAVNNKSFAAFLESLDKPA